MIARSVRLAVIGVFAGVGWLSTPGPVTAQSAAPAPRIAPDTAAIRTVMQGVYGQLAAGRAPGSGDSTSRAVEFTVPSEDSLLYDAYRRELMRILRGRAPTKADRSTFSVGIGPIAIRGDTLEVRFNIGASALCDDGVMTFSSGTSYRLVALRRGSAWGTPTVTADAFGDGICITKRPAT